MTPATTPISTPPVDYYTIPEYPYASESPELETRRAAVEARRADLEARMADLRAQAPAPARALGRKALPAKGAPALSISAPKDSTLLIAAAIGGGLLLLSYLNKKGK